MVFLQIQTDFGGRDCKLGGLGDLEATRGMACLVSGASGRGGDAELQAEQQLLARGHGSAKTWKTAGTKTPIFCWGGSTV